MFPKDLFSDYLEIKTTVVVPFGDPQLSLCHIVALKRLAIHRYMSFSVVIFAFSGPLVL